MSITALGAVLMMLVFLGAFALLIRFLTSPVWYEYIDHWRAKRKIFRDLELQKLKAEAKREMAVLEDVETILRRGSDQE